MNPKKCVYFGCLLGALLLALFPSEMYGQIQATDHTEAQSLKTNAAIFSPLVLSSPNQMRTVQGRPGSSYWQQDVNYDIKAALDPTTHRISGTVTISYTNNSPHFLHQLWLQLDQNAFSPQSRSSLIHGSATRWRGSFEEGGMSVSNISISRLGTHQSPNVTISDSRLRIDLETPLPPNGMPIDISIDFEYSIPEHGADRTGRLEVQRGTIYQIAQWYPRMYVYDDVHGWNTLPYLGQGEFYLEYGNFRVELTTPSDFMVVGTGDVVNPESVYTSEQRKRLEKARKSTDTIQIIGPKDVGKRNSRPNDSDKITWVFDAENIRDFAWAASQAFIVDAAQWEDVLIMSAYPHEALGTNNEPGWEKSTEYMLHSVQFYSNMWYRYPYPVAINVAGIVRGMEYPMIQFCSYESRGQALFGVTDHELAHNWFPMIVGSDERRHAWMDEGFVTFMHYYSALSYLGEEADRLSRYDVDFIANRMSEPTVDQPIMTPADQLRGPNVGFLAYRKPGVGLRLLREYILGPERFDPAFKAYIDAWAYKHPQPADFFRMIEQYSGEDLAWFWKGWFYGTDELDQEILVTQDASLRPRLVIRHNTGLLFPVDLLVEYEDGSTEQARIPIELFFQGNEINMDALDDPSIQRIVLDPNRQLPDSNRSNNEWTRVQG